MIKVFCLKCDKKYDRKFVTRLKDAVNKHLTKKHEFFVSQMNLKKNGIYH